MPRYISLEYEDEPLHRVSVKWDMVKRSSIRSLIAITLVLISSLVLSPILSYHIVGGSTNSLLESTNLVMASDGIFEYPNRTMTSNGTIAYSWTNWYGVDFYRLVPDSPPYDQSPLFYYNLLPFLQATGKVNAIRIHTYAHNYPINSSTDWGYFSSTYSNTKIWLQKACTTAKTYGIKVILSFFQDSGMTSENDWGGKAKVILNTNGWGTQWINDYAEIVKECQPDGVEVMNEPPDASLAGNPALNFSAYRAFVIQCINAFRNADPNVVIFVNGYNVGTDLGDWASNPLTGFSNVIYTAHIYYDGAGSGYMADYNNGNLATAKSELYSTILNSFGVQAMINAKLPVCWTEAGVENDLGLQHWDAFLNDTYNFVKQYHEGFMQFGLAPSPPESWGILNSTWNGLNAQGNLWKQYGPTP